MRKRICVLPFALILLTLAFLSLSCRQNLQEEYLEVELKRLEETYNLLDSFAEKIWPGWDNFMGIEFRVQFPNLVYLLVNPRSEVPEGYAKLEGRTVLGKEVFLNRTEELPIELKPPLKGGGGGGLTIRIMLSEIEGVRDKEQQEERLRVQINSESQILLYIHEYFHGYQAKFRPKPKKRPADKTKSQKDKQEKKKPKRKRPKGWRPPRFEVDTDYAAYKEIAGMALLKAYNEKDSKKAWEYIKDYSVARELQLSRMPEIFSKEELQTQVAEGTAVYAELRMAMQAKQNEYKPAIGIKDDPYFFGYAYVDDYIKEKMDDSIKFAVDRTLDTLGHCYTYGMYQCFLLDRFVPEWKEGFFENKKSMDGIMEEFLNLSEEEKRRIRQRFDAVYGFQNIYAKHDVVVKERDDAIALIESRNGKKYVVDFEPTKEFFTTKSRGKEIILGVRQIFLNGIEELTMGDVKLTGYETPMERPWLWTVEWVDTDAKKDEKGYNLKYEEKQGDVYRNITFKTGGFTLTAPEVQINEDADKVEIVILSKVAR